MKSTYRICGRFAAPSNTALLAVIVALTFCLSERSWALDPARDLTQYNCQTWSRQNGLPANGVNSIGQTQDGHLWFGTAASLLRFDGTEFKLLDLHSTVVRSSFVTSLVVAHYGNTKQKEPRCQRVHTAAKPQFCL